MSIESNKTDFENALTEMKETLELLRHCVDEHLMNSLDMVVSEYEGHFQGDIEYAISTINDQEYVNDSLQEVIDQLSQES